MYQFYPNRHDNGLKTFFGTTKNWNGPDIITEILLNNAAKKQIAARYITNKLWEFFAHPGAADRRARRARAGVRRRHGASRTCVRRSSTAPEFYSADGQAGSGAHADRVIVALCYYTGIDRR